MSFCHHQFFTKQDFDAGKIVFVDQIDNVVEKDKRDETLSRYARSVDVEYVFNCTISNSVQSFDYFPLRRVERYLGGLPDLNEKYTKEKYLNDVKCEFGNLSFCSDGSYAGYFKELFSSRLFPECCLTEFKALKAIYSKVSRASKYNEIFDKIKKVEKIIIEKCKRLISSTNIVDQEFFDLEYSSSRIGVYPKYGHDSFVLKSTTC